MFYVQYIFFVSYMIFEIIKEKRCYEYVSSPKSKNLEESLY
jgi:hypothetical protein